MSREKDISILFILRISAEFFHLSNESENTDKIGARYVAAWAGPASVIQSYTTDDVTNSRKEIYRIINEMRKNDSSNIYYREVGEWIYSGLQLSQIFVQLLTFLSKGIIGRDLLIITNEHLFSWDWAFVLASEHKEYENHFLGEIFNCATLPVGNIDPGFLFTLAAQLSPDCEIPHNPADAIHLIIQNNSGGRLKWVGDETEFIRTHLLSNNLSHVVIFNGNDNRCLLSLREYFHTCDPRTIQLIHMTGHIEAGKMPLGKGSLTARELEQIIGIGVLRGGPLIIMNCCYSGEPINQYDVRADRLQQINFVSSYLKAGASACLATFMPVPDETGFRFIKMFYKKIICSDSVGILRPVSVASAIRETRYEWRIANPEDFTGCSYVLFGTPRSMLISDAERRIIAGEASRSLVEGSRDRIQEVKRRVGILGLKNNDSI